MKRHIAAGLWLGVGLLLLGCNPKVGIIALDTNPQGAAIYLNGVKTGDTPAKFQFDMEKPVTLKLLKEGYEPKEEKLTVDWVKSEYHRGNYRKGDYLINGTMQKGFEVYATRELKRTEMDTLPSQATPVQPMNEPPRASQPMGEGVAKISPPKAGESTDLEKRLQALKDLREKNLITQEQYEATITDQLKTFAQPAPPNTAQGSSEFKAFLGAWGGNWIGAATSGVVKTTLTVTAVNAEKRTATVRYTRGPLTTAPSLDIQTEGVFLGARTLRVVVGEVTLTYNIAEDGTIKATRFHQKDGAWIGSLGKSPTTP